MLNFLLMRSAFCRGVGPRTRFYSSNQVPCLLHVTSHLGEDCRISFVRFVFLIPWMTFVACVRMKHYTLCVAAHFPPWDSRQRLIINFSKFKTNI